MVDTIRAVYVWEWPHYPQYYLPLADFDPAFLVDEGRTHRMKRGEAHRFGLRVGDVERPGCLRAFTDDSLPGLAGMVRVDAVRSNRPIRVELDGVLLAEASSSVMVFETGLPTRYYVERTSVDFTHLEPSSTQTPGPYKGRTSAYWSVRFGD